MQKSKKRKSAKILTLIIVGFMAVFSSVIFFKKFIKDNTCANTLSCEESFNYSVNNEELAVFNKRNIQPPRLELPDIGKDMFVLGTEETSSPSAKRIEVDLTNQKLKAYEAEELFMESTISSGKLYPTPTGEFIIWRKIRATLMSGGSGSGYYYLPNVPYVMFFSNSKVAAARGFSIHGTYWHNNFGHAMSHGCVNMKTRDAKKLYDWADPPTADDQKQSKAGELGTKIIIYGKAP